uniref:Secreted protein n=1 Tax=Aureoumbra lagunensis TaxID=44058 RepID=A0A7S3NJV8_9STRA
MQQIFCFFHMLFFFSASVSPSSCSLYTVLAADFLMQDRAVWIWIIIQITTNLYIQKKLFSNFPSFIVHCFFNSKFIFEEDSAFSATTTTFPVVRLYINNRQIIDFAQIVNWPILAF